MWMMCKCLDEDGETDLCWVEIGKEGIGVDGRKIDWRDSK